MSNKNFRYKLLSGLRWTVLNRFGVSLISFLVTLLMARLLNPGDFGLVAMAVVFTGISLVFVDLGTKDAIIREKNNTQEFISSIFWLNISLSLFVWLGLILSASIVADIYDEAIVETIIYIMSLNILVSGLTITFQAQLEKEMRFKPIAIAQVVSRIISSSIGIFMAVSGYGVWSLVFMNVAAEFIYTSIIIINVKKLPAIKLSFAHIRKIYNFSLYLTLTQLLYHLQRRLEIFTVAYFLGNHFAGVYSQTHTMMRQPVKLLNGSFTSVVYSALSSISNEKERTRLLYLKLIQTFALVYIPLSVLFLLFSDPLVLFVLGEKWLELAKLTPVFGIIILFLSFHRGDVLVLKSSGRPKLLFRIYLAYLPITILGCAISSQFGLFWVAISMLIASFLLFITSMMTTTRFLEINFSSYISQINRLLVYGVLMLITGYFIKAYTIKYFDENSIISAIIGIFFCLVTYISALLIRPVDAWTYVLTFLNLGKTGDVATK